MLLRLEPSGLGRLDLAWEPFGDVIEEALPLLRRHYAELGLKEGGSFNPDWRSLFYMAWQGRLRVATARDGGKLVGYCAGLRINMLACQEHQVIMVNAIYIDPFYRGRISTVRAFLVMMIGFAHEFGATRLEMAPQGRHRAGIGRLLQKLGWAASDEPSWRLEV